MKSPILIAALVALGAAAFTPLASNAQPHVSVVISTAPPPPIREVIPAPRRGHVWAPGYWEWRAHRHHWVPGHYVVARPGYVYAPPSWHHRGGRWVMEPSRWNRGPSHHHRPPPHAKGHRDHHHGPRGRDRDRDGVPDRHDRRPHNPHRY